LVTPSKNRESPNDITAEVGLTSLALFRDRLLLIATLAEILWLAIHLHRKREVIAHLLQGRTPPALVAIGVKCIA